MHQRKNQYLLRQKTQNLVLHEYLTEGTEIKLNLIARIATKNETCHTIRLDQLIAIPFVVFWPTWHNYIKLSCPQCTGSIERPCMKQTNCSQKKKVWKVHKSQWEMRWWGYLVSYIKCKVKAQTSRSFFLLPFDSIGKRFNMKNNLEGLYVRIHQDIYIKKKQMSPVNKQK